VCFDGRNRQPLCQGDKLEVTVAHWPVPIIQVKSTPKSVRVYYARVGVWEHFHSFPRFTLASACNCRSEINQSLTCV
jgi:hypothetical protein